MKPYIFACLLLFNFWLCAQVPEIIPYRKSNLWGYVNEKKEILIPIEFTYAEPFVNGSAVVKHGKQFKLIDKKANSLFVCDSIVRVADFPNLLVLIDQKWGLIDPKGKILVKVIYPSIYSDNKAIASIYFGPNESGRIDVRNGSVYVYPGSEIYPPQQGYAEVKKDDKTGLIDSTGRLLIPIKFDQVSVWSEGTILTGMQEGEEGKYGLYNKQGKEILKAEYDDISVFKEGLARVRKNEDYGFIDTSGKFVLPLKYKFATEFSEGIAIYIDESDQLEPNVFINKQGQELFRKNYPGGVGKFSEGLCLVGHNVKGSIIFGYINTKGEEVIPFQFDGAYSFCEGRALVVRGTALYIIDKSGKPIDDEVYYDIVRYAGNQPIEPCFNSGKIRLQKRIPGIDRWFMGMVNINGEVITPFQYEEIGVGGSQLLSSIQTADGSKLYGFVDSASGKPITELKYSYAYPFYEGMAMVSLIRNGQGYCGFINTKGEEAVEIKYQQIQSFSEGLAAVKLDELWGFVDKNGKVVIDFKYGYRQYLQGLDSGIKNGLIKVYKNSKEGYIDIKGNEYFED